LVGHKESCCPFKELKNEEFKKIKDWITKTCPALLASKIVPKKNLKRQFIMLRKDLRHFIRINL